MLKNKKIFEGGERQREAQRIIIAGSPYPFFQKAGGDSAKAGKNILTIQINQGG
jgi:hypothetical protein